MEPLRENDSRIPKLFIVAGLGLLFLAMAFGIVGALQYVVPGLLKQYLSFEKVRPLHVSSAVFWIIFGAMGGTLAYLQRFGEKPYRPGLLRLQFWILSMAVILILGSYLAGIFGGREYWEFPPPLAILIIVAWILYVINVVSAVKTLRGQPVYIWMWITGAFGFLFTFSESYLWVFPYFQQHIVRDMTVQWKSYGSMVGCWNMLVYGLGLYLMEKISNDTSYAQSRMGFALFFLGFFNLLFNWSHHIYTLPIPQGIKNVGYLVSMTELFILGRIIYKWKASVTTAQKFNHLLPFRFLMAADIWVFLNLSLAILMSIPAFNVFTHGTHITVAHSMGTTIGINTMLLLAVAFDVLNPERKVIGTNLIIKRSIWVVGISLFVFLSSLVLAGVHRAKWQMAETPVSFGTMMNGITPYFVAVTVAGIIIFLGLAFIILALFRVVKGSR
ncbi:MAG: cbb3-type cytochrome c oxidase subunit I [Bacteroidetes bacterium]|nr:cbb3-type cytochrome c oxidase subunit I [Bacteroidota bacterium]